MSSRLRPSPAAVIATIALFAAVSGAAYAGGKVATAKLANGSVTAAKLARNAVTAPKIRANAVRTKHIRNDAVTGEKIAEGSLGAVPTATSAQTANTATTATTAENANKVNNLSLEKFSVTQQPNTALTTVKTIGTLQLQFGCTAGSVALFRVVPTAGAPAQGLRFSTIRGDNTVKSGGEGTMPAAGDDILTEADQVLGADGQIEANAVGGQVTTVQWGARSGFDNVPSANPDPPTCVFYGTGITG